MDNLTIVDRIEARIVEVGMSKEEFYKQSGISSASLSQWRKRVYSPSIKKIKKAADILKVSEKWLLGLSDQKEKPAPISEDGLSEDVKFLLSMYHSVPAEKRAEALAKIASDLKKAGLID